MKEKIMEAISSDIQEMMCSDCEHAGFTPATFNNPPESACPGEFEPWDGGCRRQDEYEEIEKLAGQFVRDIQVVIFGRVSV